jgi:nucleoside-triphosphatase THEP1
MSCAIIIHGAIGSGKTLTCLRLSERAVNEGVSVRGVLSPRVFEAGELIGYDGLDPASGLSFPLVRLRTCVKGSGWSSLSNLKYAFSIEGFERANIILSHSADTMSRRSFVFVDEFGRLERMKGGIYPGALTVAKALIEGGAAVFACRTNLVEDVLDLVSGRAGTVHVYEPGHLEPIWRRVRGCLERAG